MSEPEYLAEDVVAGRDPGTAVLRGQGAATAAVAAVPGSRPATTSSAR